MFREDLLSCVFQIQYIKISDFKSRSVYTQQPHTGQEFVLQMVLTVPQPPGSPAKPPSLWLSIPSYMLLLICLLAHMPDCRLDFHAHVFDHLDPLLTPLGEIGVFQHIFVWETMKSKFSLFVLFEEWQFYWRPYCITSWIKHFQNGCLWDLENLHHAGDVLVLDRDKAQGDQLPCA